MGVSMSTARAFADAFFSPARGLATAAERGSFAPALVAATLASLLLACVAVPRIDFERAFDERAERDPGAAERMSPHDREMAVAQARKVGAVLAYGAAVCWPALRALAIACCALIASRVAASRPPFRGLLAAASWGCLPLALRDLLSVPALSRMRGISAYEAERVLPSSLAALLPAGAPAPVAGVAQALDLFAIWAVALVALGTARVSGDDRGRGFAVVAVLWVAYVLLAHVALPNLLPGGAG